MSVNSCRIYFSKDLTQKSSRFENYLTYSLFVALMFKIKEEQRSSHTHSVIVWFLFFMLMRRGIKDLRSRLRLPQIEESAIRAAFWSYHSRGKEPNAPRVLLCWVCAGNFPCVEKKKDNLERARAGGDTNTFAWMCDVCNTSARTRVSFFVPPCIANALGNKNIQ